MGHVIDPIMFAELDVLWGRHYTTELRNSAKGTRDDVASFIFWLSKSAVSTTELRNLAPYVSFVCA